MKRLITKEAREKLKELIPNLDSYNCKCKKEDHWNLFRVFAFNHYIDKETGAVRLGAETIARAVNKLNTFRAGRFNASNYLQHFINEIIPNIATVLVDEEGRDWSKGKYTLHHDGSITKEGGKQRRVIINWPSGIKEVIRKEINKEFIGEKVYISNGNKKNLEKERSVSKDTQNICQQEIDILNCKPAKDIAQYLNNLPLNSFTKIVENCDYAIKVANKIDNENSKLQQLLILDLIQEAPKPFVKPSENTDRLFGYGANITNLKKEVRKALTKGWYEADLKSAQLAIVAKLWNIPEVISFLQSGKSFWKEMMAYLNVDDSAKSLIKDHTYGVIFGMSKERLVEEMDLGLKEYGIENGGNLFLQNPIISALIKGRSKYISKLLKEGTMIDAFGEVFEVNKLNILSILARQAQSYEMALIYPIFELAKTTNDFSIQLYQFDGVSINFHNKKRLKNWMSLIEACVENKANELNMYTSLEIVENIGNQELIEFVNLCKDNQIEEVSGVYCMYDKSTNYAVFKKSTNVLESLIKQKERFIAETHSNRKLQNAFNRSSLIAFLAEEVRKEDLHEAEKYFSNRFKG